MFFWLFVNVGKTVAEELPRIDTSNYPALSAKQIGHVRHMVALAHQKPGDWAFMGHTPPGSGNDAYQFQIAFMTYALGITHYHSTPAYRELYQKASVALIDKMIFRDVWDYWERMSKSHDYLEEDGSHPAKAFSDRFGWIDPIVRKNVMYSGHLLQMVSLYEALFDDRRYDRSDSLVFHAAPLGYGEPVATFAYDHQRLAEVLYEQFVEDGYRGIDCERGAVYIDCNQHPVLGLIHFDQTHATDYAVDVQRGLQKQIQERSYISPITHTVMSHLDVATDSVVPAISPYLDGWTGHAYHVWEKEYAEALYREQVKRYLPAMLEPAPGEDAGSHISFDFGWFALSASEVGDTKTVEAMLDYADEHFNPAWRDGAYYYPHTPDYRTNFERDEDGYIANVSPVTGNALLGFTRLNPQDGLWTLYNRRWEEAHFAEPFVSDVDHAKVSVSQAVYDRSKDALIVTLVPGPMAPSTTSFTIRQLSSRTTYALIKDGELLGELTYGIDSTVPGARWTSDDTLRISTALGELHSFVIMPSS